MIYINIYIYIFIYIYIYIIFGVFGSVLINSLFLLISGLFKLDLYTSYFGHLEILRKSLYVISICILDIRYCCAWKY